jgi:hypothetical protein
MTNGTRGVDDRAEVKRIVLRLDALQAALAKEPPHALCEGWILKRLDDCIARIEALKVMNQRMRTL